MKKLFLLPLFALIASCGGAESNNDLSENEFGETEEMNEVVENNNFIRVQRITGELGNYQYNEIKRIDGEDCLNYVNTEHEVFEITISLQNEVEMDADVILECLEGQKFDRETFMDDPEVFKTNVLSKTDQKISWKRSAGNAGVGNKVAFTFTLM